MHRIMCPTVALAVALAEFINAEGGTATYLSDGTVLAEAKRETVDSACLALSFGTVGESSKRYRRSHYARAFGGGL